LEGESGPTGHNEKTMTTSLTWNEILLRLALTFAAGTLIGINRGEHGRPAGLRTTLLICLAAAIAMIQANLLLGTAGKSANSFVVLDLMRLPLGILTGVGFIGAGAILRKEGLVVGVTTAATLWFVTVMGLCFGGGQIGLGLAALGLNLLVLSGLKHVEEHWRQDRQGTFILTVGLNGPGEDQISQMLSQAGYKIQSISVIYLNDSQTREYNCAIRWRGLSSEKLPPVFVQKIAHCSGVTKLVWNPL
jgi:putative Mg2+ transporter-C (MgtC) family protein